MPYLTRSGETPKPLTLLGGAIATNHHVYHIGTFVPSSSFSDLHPQPWVNKSARFSCHCLSNAMITNAVGFLLMLGIRALSVVNVDMLSPYIWVSPSMGTPIILSLYHNPHETSMASFHCNRFCTKSCTFYSCLSLCIPNDACHIDEETESHVGSISDLVICMIRVNKSSKND